MTNLPYFIRWLSPDNGEVYVRMRSDIGPGFSDEVKERVQATRFDSKAHARDFIAKYRGRWLYAKALSLAEAAPELDPAPARKVRPGEDD